MIWRHVEARQEKWVTISPKPRLRTKNSSPVSRNSGRGLAHTVSELQPSGLLQMRQCHKLVRFSSNTYVLGMIDMNCSCGSLKNQRSYSSRTNFRVYTTSRPKLFRTPQLQLVLRWSLECWWKSIPSHFKAADTFQKISALHQCSSCCINSSVVRNLRSSCPVLSCNVLSPPRGECISTVTYLCCKHSWPQTHGAAEAWSSCSRLLNTSKRHWLVLCQAYK